MSYRENAIALLIHFLENGNEADRCYAARSLGEIKATNAASSLIERLRDEDIDVCIDAATALGQIADGDTSSSLLEALTNEPDGEVKTAITTSLGHFNDYAVKEALNKLALNRPEELEEALGDWDCYWDIQLEAIKSLTKLGGTDKTDEIAALIENEDGQDIEAEILKVLAHSGEDGFKHLENKLGNPLERTRRRAAQALRFQDSQRSRLALKNALSDSAEDVRLSSLASIAHLQAGELLNEVIELMSDSSPRVRKEALRALASLGSSTGKVILTADHLLPLLTDNDSEVRLTILSLLSDLAHQSTAQFSPEQLVSIKTCLNSVNADEAAIACSILGDVQDKDAIPSFIDILENTQEDEMLRKEAVISLGKLGVASPSVMTTLQKHITGESRVIRLSVLQALMTLEEAMQDTQVLTLSTPANSSGEETEAPNDSSDNAQSEAGEDSVILDPMELLIASLYGEIVPDPDEQSKTPGDIDDNDGLERIEAVNIEENSDTGQANEEPFYDASHSTLSSITEEKPLIPEDYPSDYRELEGSESNETTSTLEALTKGNVEATLMSERPMEPHVQSIMNMVEQLPEELKEFGEAVKANNSAAEQMIDQSKRSSLKNDVRHLAARVLASTNVSKENLSETQRDKIDRIVEGLTLALSDQDELLRCEAADTICQLATKNSKTPSLSNTFGGLVTQLQFGTPEFRVKAVKALGPLEHKAGIPPLLDCLEDQDSNVRIHAIYSLGRLIRSKWSDQKESHHMVLEDVTSERVIQKIIGMLNDPDNGVRKAAIDILTDLNNQTAVERMITIALENGGAMARVIGKALRKINSSEASALVTERLKQSENTVDRRFLMEVIEEMFKPEKIQSDFV